MTIAYRYFLHPQPRGMVIVSQGYAENLRKYAEVVYDLHRRGYSVIVFDHRGQGYSGRMIADSRRGYVDRFANFVKDFKSLFDTTRTLQPEQPRYLLAHSMGAVIAADFMAREPASFRAAVLASPMFQIRLGGLSEGAATWLADRRRPESYAIGWRQPARRWFRFNLHTHSRARFETLDQAVLRADPGLGLWGPSVEWVRQGIAGSACVRALAGTQSTPTLILQAGKDALVYAQAQDDFAARGADAHLMRFPEAGHEILMESDSIRDEALDAADQFFTRHP